MAAASLGSESPSPLPSIIDPVPIYDAKTGKYNYIPPSYDISGVKKIISRYTTITNGIKPSSSKTNKIEFEDVNFLTYDLSNPVTTKEDYLKEEIDGNTDINSNIPPRQHYFLVVADNVLSREMCRKWRNIVDNCGLEPALIGQGSVATEIRDSGRCLLFSKSMAKELFEKVKNCTVVPEKVIDPYGYEWKLMGLNERLSFLKYEYPDHRFLPHADGLTRYEELYSEEGEGSDEVDLKTEKKKLYSEEGEGSEEVDLKTEKKKVNKIKMVQSFFTVQVYLNDLVSDVDRADTNDDNSVQDRVNGGLITRPSDNLEIDSKNGGATRFFIDRRVMQRMSDLKRRDELISCQCIPKEGRAGIFDHRWVHEGQELKEKGCIKYTCRTDILYSRIIDISEKINFGKSDGGPEGSKGSGPHIVSINEKQKIVPEGIWRKSDLNLEDGSIIIHHSHTRKELNGVERRFIIEEEETLDEDGDEDGEDDGDGSVGDQKSSSEVRIYTVFKGGFNDPPVEPTRADYRKRRIIAGSILLITIILFFKGVMGIWDYVNGFADLRNGEL